MTDYMSYQCGGPAGYVCAIRASQLGLKQRGLKNNGWEVFV
jgi:pyruvate/2-oxoglutarate dehydrogenase complex dihydrolipoamide dehydrogenase (E3) component